MNIYRSTKEMKEQAKQMAQQYNEEISNIKKHFSLQHPYKYPVRALHLISPIVDMARVFEGVSLDEALSKIDPALFKARDFALQAIETTQAFVYVDKKLRNDSEFVQEAIKRNPAIFDLLDSKMSQKPEIQQCYIQSFISSFRFHLVEKGSNIFLPATMIVSPKINPQDIFSPEKYKHEFEEALKRPFFRDYKLDEHLSKHVAFVVAAQTFCPELADQYRAAEKEVLLQNPELIEKTLVNGYASHYQEAQSLSDVLDEVFQDSAVLMDKFEALRAKSWENYIQRIVDIHEKFIDDGNRTEMYMIEHALGHLAEMQKYVPLTDELKQALNLMYDPRSHFVKDEDGFKYDQDLMEIAERR